MHTMQGSLKQGSPPLVVVGSGRSGTTWVVDVLAKANGLRVVFEPLHPQAVKGAQPFAGRQIEPGAVPAGAEAFFDPVLSGAFHSLWADYRVRPDRLKYWLLHAYSPTGLRRSAHMLRKLYRGYRRYAPDRGRDRSIVKFIRANLMIEWLCDRYGARVLYVVRHPGSVIESKIRKGGDDWDPYPDLGFYMQDRAVTERLGIADLADSYRDLDPVEAHTLIWCIENRQALAGSLGARYHRVYYEDLVRNPGEAWVAPVDYLGLSVVPGDSLLKKPSQQSSQLSLTSGFDATHLAGWMKRLGPQNTARLGAMLARMNIRDYTADDPYPV